MKPSVILHVGISLDGWIDWSQVKDSPYYELAQRLGADADLSGSVTMLRALQPPSTAGADSLRCRCESSPAFR